MDNALPFESPPEQKLRELIAGQIALDEKLDKLEREVRGLRYLLSEVARKLRERA